MKGMIIQIQTERNGTQVKSMRRAWRIQHILNITLISHNLISPKGSQLLFVSSFRVFNTNKVLDIGVILQPSNQLKCWHFDEVIGFVCISGLVSVIPKCKKRKEKEKKEALYCSSVKHI